MCVVGRGERREGYIGLNISLALVSFTDSEKERLGCQMLARYLAARQPSVSYSQCLTGGLRVSPSKHLGPKKFDGTRGQKSSTLLRRLIAWN